jgi:DNA-binding IclR family transcriptional regulator
MIAKRNNIHSNFNRLSGVRPLSSALKTLAVLDVLAKSDGPMRLVELTSAIGESRATIYQKLFTLIAAGWVETVDPAGFRLSLRATLIGDAALRQASLGERSIAVMRDAALLVGEAVSLAIFSGNYACIVRRVEAEVVVRAQVRVGTLLSLADSASGRVLTAFSTPEYRKILKRNGAKLASESLLNEVRCAGYAVSRGSDVPGVRSVSVPLLNANKTCIAALSIVAPESRFNCKRLLLRVREAATKINALIAGDLPKRANAV